MIRSKEKIRRRLSDNRCIQLGKNILLSSQSNITSSPEDANSAIAFDAYESTRYLTEYYPHLIELVLNLENVKHNQKVKLLNLLRVIAQVYIEARSKLVRSLNIVIYLLPPILKYKLQTQRYIQTTTSL